MAFGRAKYVITDQGGEFRGGIFRKTAARLGLDDLEQRLENALTHYLCFRPHQALRGATPAEVLLGQEPASSTAGSPPRGRLGEGPQQAPFRVGFLDPESRSFPILKKTA